MQPLSSEPIPAHSSEMGQPQSHSIPISAHSLRNGQGGPILAHYIRMGLNGPSMSTPEYPRVPPSTPEYPRVPTSTHEYPLDCSRLSHCQAESQACSADGRELCPPNSFLLTPAAGGTARKC